MRLHRQSLLALEPWQPPLATGLPHLASWPRRVDVIGWRLARKQRVSPLALMEKKISCRGHRAGDGWRSSQSWCTAR